MHAALYAGLVVLIMFAIDLRPSIKALIWVILISLGVGIVQEGLQLLSGAQSLRWNSLIDLGVDTGGALFGYIMVIRIRKLREIKVSSQS
jgi:VanZ family protein